MKEDKQYQFPDALEKAMKLWKEDDEQRQSQQQPAAPDPSPASPTDSKDDPEDDFER